MSNHVPGLFITGTDTGVGKTYVAALIARQLAAEGRAVGVYKPAASGCRRQGGALVSDDALALWEAAGRPDDLQHVCPQLFEAPLAPHLAAWAEGRELDADLLRRGIDYWRRRSEIILVEGAGGLMSPLGDDEYVADLAAELGFPLVVVSPNVLGTINQTMQTLIAASTFGGELGDALKTPVMESRCATAGLSSSEAGNLLNFTAGQASSGTRIQQTFKRVGALSIAGVVLNHPRPPSSDDASLSSNRRELAARCRPPILGEVGWGAERLAPAVDWFALAR